MRVERQAWGARNTTAVSIASSLEYSHISHSYETDLVLKDVSITVDPGNVLCLLGPSGSGKTTLLRIAAGIENQTSGRVLLDGREIAGPGGFLPPERRGIGLVFQDYALFPHLSILDNVKFGLTNLKAGQKRPHALALLQRVGLASMADDFPDALSGGEQQRVALARALAPRPGILLLDEPFSGLDSRLRDSVRTETLAVLRESRATAIIVTHDPEEALMMGDQIVLLRDGEVEQQGAGRGLFDNPQSLFAASFFSPLNIFSGTVKNGKVDTPLGEISAGDLPNGTAATACVRHSAVRIAENPDQGKQARVLRARFMGDHDLLTITIAGTDHRVEAKRVTGTLSDAQRSGHEDIYVSALNSGSFVFAD